MSNENQKPEMQLSDGNIRAALWKQEGPNGSFYSTTFSKSYRDDQGNYHNSQSFAGTYLLKVSQLAQQAYQHSRELQLQDRQAQRSTEKDRSQYRSR